MSGGDTYWTLAATAEGLYTEKRSKFIAYVLPVRDSEEALTAVAAYREQYYDARHVCWAYRLQPDGTEMRSNDDGEPSGTAGKPILGRLVAENLTFVVAIVIRYFGGVKLGTGGLGVAYRMAVEEALNDAERLEVIRTTEIYCAFSYELLGEVMRIVKDTEASVLEQDFTDKCRLRLGIRLDDAEKLTVRLEKIYGVALLKVW